MRQQDCHHDGVLNGEAMEDEDIPFKDVIGRVDTVTLPPVNV